MLRRLWVVLGAVALVASACETGLLAGDKHPPADIALAVGDFDHGREADTTTEGMFAPPVSYHVGSAPTAVATGDFDQDGRQDLVTANWRSRDVTVLLGHGDGTFAAAVSYAGGTVPNSVAVGDFDRDGRQDLVTANVTTRDVTVWLGHGDGTFAAGANYAAGGAPRSVATGDFDRDGRQDLVTVNFDLAFSVVTVLLGRGDGTFSTPAFYETGLEPISVAVGDFDQDGREDLATANVTVSTVAVLLGYGDGTFAGAGGSYVDPFPVSIAVGDFDQDGRQDLVTANDSSNYVTVLLGHGDGTFSEAVRYAVVDLPASVAVGDFDQDGREDLVTANWGSGDVSVLLGHGDGTFAVGANYAAARAPRSVAVGDFDQDGRQDLAVANEGSDNISVLLNQGGPLHIDVDIKPDDLPNNVNPYARGVIPVAILGSDTFNVVDVDVTTLAFGPGGAPIAHRDGHPQDVNYDGIMDLSLHFRTQDTGIACGDDSATLTGETLEGRPIEGTDSIQTVGCRETRRPAIWMKDLEREGKPRSDGPVNIERK